MIKKECPRKQKGMSEEILQIDEKNVKINGYISSKKWKIQITNMIISTYIRNKKRTLVPNMPKQQTV